MATKKLKATEVATMADQYWSIRQRRLALDKEVAELAKSEAQLKEAIHQWLKDNNLTAIGGGLVRVTMVPDVYPIVANWDKLYAHILKTKQFDLLHRRLTATAVAARWELNETVPGVDRIEDTKLSWSVNK